MLDLDEAARHPHLAARGSLRIDERGAVIAAPAPRFSRTPGELLPAATPSRGDAVLLDDLGLDEDRIRALREAGVIGTA